MQFYAGIWWYVYICSADYSDFIRTETQKEFNVYTILIKLLRLTRIYGNHYNMTANNSEPPPRPWSRLLDGRRRLIMKETPAAAAQPLCILSGGGCNKFTAAAANGG
jgi:hypothetical protein